MIGKIRGFLILFFIFAVLSAGVAVLAFVDIDRVWFSVKSLAGRAFTDSDGAHAQTTSWDKNLETAQIFTDAAYEALKSGKAKPGDLYDLGQLYYKSKSDGQIDDDEMNRMMELADRTGIMDAVIDQALAPAGESAQTSGNEKTPNMETELKGLMGEFEQARVDGRLNPGELMSILNRARNSGLQNRLAEMMPGDYDQTRARTAARDLAKAVATGRASMDNAKALMQMFMRAQTDGRLDRQELDQITRTAEAFAR